MGGSARLLRRALRRYDRESRFTAVCIRRWTQFSVKTEGAKVDLNDTPEQAQYREHVRSWLEEHKGEAPARSGSVEDPEYVNARRKWQGKLAQAGLPRVTLAQEDGGHGLRPSEHRIVWHWSPR